MTIVAAVDRSDHRARIVDQGIKLASAFDQPLHVVHVLTQSEFFDLERTNVERTGRMVNKDEIQAIAAEIAEESLGTEPNVPYETVGHVGPPADEIVAYAEDVDADYVVVGGRRRSPVGKVVMGSVTQSVLLNADCPVLGVLHDRAGGD